MTAPKSFAYSFRNVYVRKKDRIVLVASYDPSLNTDSIISSTMIWTGEKWLAHDSIPSNATAFGMTNNPRAPLMLGKEGVVYLLKDVGGFDIEEIDGSGLGPQNYGDMQDLRIVNDTVYAAGAARCVYKRNKSGSWKDIAKSIRSEDDDSSFMSIDGYSSTELYAVGMDGEIAWYDGKIWQFVEPLTNLILYSVLCAPNGQVYACGQGGILLTGRNSNWRVVEQGLTEENFWSCAWFSDQLYLSTDEGLISYDEEEMNLVDIVDHTGAILPIDKGTGFYRLDSNGEVLYSVGSKAVVWTEDAKSWKEISYESSD